MQIRENKTLKLKLSMDEYNIYFNEIDEIEKSVTLLLLDKNIINEVNDLEEVRHIKKTNNSFKFTVDIISTTVV